MRICLMNDNFYRSSGAAMGIRRLALALTGVEFYVASCVGDGRSEDVSWVPDGKYAAFDLKSANPVKTVTELYRLKKWLRETGCSLVHCHHRRLSVLIQLAGIPVLYTAQLAFPNALWFRWLHPRRIVAITPSVAVNIMETTGQKALACISNAVPFPDLPPQVDLSAVQNRAVCVGRLEPVKGHMHLLAAWKILADRGHQFELDLVGEGSLKPELEAQIQRDGLSKLIRFRGFTDKVSDLVSESLFAILASRVEGQGIVTLEAASTGRASLLTAVPGSIDTIPPDHALRNGIAFGDEVGLADAIEEWFSKPDEVVLEGKRFFEFLKASSDPKSIAKKYEELYGLILTGQA